LNVLAARDFTTCLPPRLGPDASCNRGRHAGPRGCARSAPGSAAEARGLGAPLTGAITFAQRFGGLVNLNIHFHLVVPDGLFVDEGDRLRFVMRPVPTNADVLAILDRIMRRVARRLADEASDLDDEAAPPHAGPGRGRHDVAITDRRQAHRAWHRAPPRGNLCGPRP
jgi:hypothetical protein